MSRQPLVATAVVAAALLTAGCGAPAATAPGPAAPASTPPAAASTPPATPTMPATPTPTPVAAPTTPVAGCPWLTEEQVRAALGEHTPKDMSRITYSESAEEEFKRSGCRFGGPAIPGQMSFRLFRLVFADVAAAKKWIAEKDPHDICSSVSGLAEESTFCTTPGAGSWAKILQARTGAEIRQTLWISGSREDAAKNADLQGPLTTLLQQTDWPAS